MHIAVTRSPTDAWVAQQLCEAAPWDESLKYPVHDRDKKYGTRFTSVARGTGIEELKTPYRAPKANAVWEMLKAGSWNRGRSNGGSQVIEAFAAATESDLTSATELWNGMTDAEQKAMRKHPRMKAEIARIRAERAAQEAALHGDTDQPIDIAALMS